MSGSETASNKLKPIFFFRMDKKTLFALFGAFLGFVLSFAIFCFGYASIIGNAHMGPEDSYGWICKSVMPLFLNSTCEICYGPYSTIPTTLIGLVGMVYNGLFFYGLVMKKPKIFVIWMYCNFFSTMVLVFTLVSYFFSDLLTLRSVNDVTEGSTQKAHMCASCASLCFLEN